MEFEFFLKVLSVVAFSDLFSSFDNLDLRKLEFDLVDDKHLIVWASSASDQAMYDRLIKEIFSK